MWALVSIYHNLSKFWNSITEMKTEYKCNINYVNCSERINIKYKNIIQPKTYSEYS